MKVGSKGGSVMWLQIMLNELGYKLTTDGSYGKNVETAVKKFQKKSKLTADGSCGPKTLTKLKEALM